MAKFLTTRQTTSQLESIIANARSQLVLISPYVRIADNLFPSLQQADQKKVRTTLVFGKQQLDPIVRKQLERLDHLTLCFVPKLHAKCYYNETQMVISSLNLYDFSENNFEMGILLDAQYDDVAYATAKEHAETIINFSATTEAERQSTREPRRPYVEAKVSLQADSGHCIRCSKTIPFAPVEKPYCRDCSHQWNKQHDHEEKYCHSCGQPRRNIDFDHPKCKSCWTAAQKTITQGRT